MNDERLPITVVIPTRNRGDLISETVESLRELDYPDFDVLVVDQSTDELTRRAVARAAAGDPRFRVEPTSTVGSSAARNIGARLATAPVVAYTDDDCIADRRWLRAIAEEFRREDVSAVYGRLVPYEGDARTGTEVGFKAAGGRTEYREKTPPWYIGHGGNMSFRRDVLLALGGFDPLLGAGGRFGACEDPDLAYRLLARGHRVVYCSGALVRHKHWKDWNAQKRMERAYGIGAGAQFGKYLRSGDAYGLRLLGTWMWQLGVRRVGSGLLKWRSTRPMYLGYCQLVYPWIGMARSLAAPVDRRRMLYVDA